MKDWQAIFNNKINKIFSSSGSEIEKTIIETFIYVDDFIQLSDDISFEDIIRFIDKYEDSIISNSLIDEEFKDLLLTNGDMTYRIYENKIDEDYLKNIISNIRNKNFNYESIIYLLDIIKLINIYGINCEPEKMNNILDNGIYSIVENLSFVSDGDTIIEADEINKKTDILIEWNKIFGNKILNQIFNLEVLLVRLVNLYESDRKEILAYKDNIRSLINTCKLAMSIRDSGGTPDISQINDINNLFSNYEEINKSLIIDSINNGEFDILHFVQNDPVNYQLVGNQVINTNELVETHEQGFNQKQNNGFINDYVEKMKDIITLEEEDNFDYKNNVHREKLQNFLNFYNKKFNTDPLYRFPINIREMNSKYKTVIRQSNNRLSCSFCNINTDIKSHLDRKIALMVRPINVDAILTTSVGYTSQKDFYDFRHDSVSYLQLIDQIYNSSITNEIGVDASKAEVVGILILDNDEKVFERASSLAESYNVPIINKTNTIYKK